MKTRIKGVQVDLNEYARIALDKLQQPEFNNGKKKSINAVIAELLNEYLVDVYQFKKERLSEYKKQVQ
ncbi:hypothetical protein [Pseudoalteromonas sp. JC3]|uniref:hypothetical protein n=1 Tax=Pseudoalteromonas sp. JC3 TaxID=2810196 RepID=UPI0019D1727B|nr:hypothetical protein [Pseudoalteromonas sp. JC3]MBR8841674.1 hypothetical protein [Pseudoalteromonas sp. JC3]WJE07699.1 hypothetical protein QSH61_12440 [Pseudoalteromonas sp. JC3]